jgi:hypothetical protein
MTRELHTGRESPSQGVTVLGPIDRRRAVVESILMEEIDLAKPDDVAFLESQVPHIVDRILRFLHSSDGHAR